MTILVLCSVQRSHTLTQPYGAHLRTTEDALACSVADTKVVLENPRRCRKVKELASILGICHQKLACLDAGYSEEHCSSNMSCCLID